jgi:anti-sigma regulatory factor (Ser/Thr protein kinase)
VSLRQGDWRSELSATLEAVEQFCIEFKVWRAGNCPDLDPFSGELLLRETLTNSVLHGCSGDPRKSILCSLRSKPGRLVIVIRDSGEGFDWRAAWGRRSDVSDLHGRGMEILRLYASSVRFNRAGNSVALVKRFQKEERV